MKKRVFGRQFSRTKNQRKLLFRNLIHSFLSYGKIRTTEAKAKAIKGEIEKIVTKARNDGEKSAQQLTKVLTPEVFDHVITHVAPQFKDRNGGYTRIVKLGNRLKDNAPVVMLQWVEWSNAFVLERKSEKRDKTKVKALPEKAESKVKVEKKEEKPKKKAVKTAKK